MLNSNAKKWVEALRSGEYRQGKGFLRTDKDEFCCLGVACDLAVKEGVIPVSVLDEDDTCYKYDDHSSYLPKSVKNWLGLDSAAGEYNQGSLVLNNDCNKLTFNEIADIIESEPEGLFVS